METTKQQPAKPRAKRRLALWISCCLVMALAGCNCQMGENMRPQEGEVRRVGLGTPPDYYHAEYYIRTKNAAGTDKAKCFVDALSQLRDMMNEDKRKFLAIAIVNLGDESPDSEEGIIIRIADLRNKALSAKQVYEKRVFECKKAVVPGKGKTVWDWQIVTHHQVKRALRKK